MEKENSPAKYKFRPDTLIFSGTARLPENISAKHVYGCFTIEVEVDPRDNKIVDASGTMLPALGEKILLSALIGYEMEEGIRNACDQIERRFYSVTKRAVIAALESVYQWHRRYLEGKA